jgi:hypothetical protein
MLAKSRAFETSERSMAASIFLCGGTDKYNLYMYREMRREGNAERKKALSKYQLRMG